MGVMTTSGTAAPPPTTPTSSSGTGASRVAARRPVRLRARANLPVVVGIVALVTLAAFENRAFITILPTVVRELDGWALFGASTGARLVTFTVAMAWSGGWTDRPALGPCSCGGSSPSSAAQAVSALAPTMAVFVAGRAVSGAAEALIDTSLIVLVAQALPEELRAKVFASFAAAWILPSLLGPSLAGRSTPWSAGGLSSSPRCSSCPWRSASCGPPCAAPTREANRRRMPATRHPSVVASPRRCCSRPGWR